MKTDDLKQISLVEKAKAFCLSKMGLFKEQK